MVNEPMAAQGRPADPRVIQGRPASLSAGRAFAQQPGAPEDEQQAKPNYQKDREQAQQDAERVRAEAVRGPDEQREEAGASESRGERKEARTVKEDRPPSSSEHPPGR